MLGAMAATSGTRASRGTAARSGTRHAPKWTVPPVLVRQERNGIVESVHRGDIVEVDGTGRMRHVIGDPDRMVTLRSTVKPFGLVALLAAGGVAEFDLTTEELAVMAASHSGEDLHVRTVQAMYRRIGLATSLLQTGTDGSPLDELTAARLARDGERPSVLRHMCSGQHSVFVLLAKLGGWPLETYWEADHPASLAYGSAVATMFGVRPDRLMTGVDGCGVQTYAFRLRDVARAFAILADPTAIPADDPRAAIGAALLEIRDAMRAHPELVAGTRDRLDTSLMKALGGGVVSKSGVEALRGIAILPGARGSSPDSPASGMAIKIEDGDGHERGTWSATVEALRQVGAVDDGALRALARYHRPVYTDPHGRTIAQAVAEFELAPVGELVD